MLNIAFLMQYSLSKMDNHKAFLNFDNEISIRNGLAVSFSGISCKSHSHLEQKPNFFNIKGKQENKTFEIFLCCFTQNGIYIYLFKALYWSYKCTHLRLIQKGYDYNSYK